MKVNGLKCITNRSRTRPYAPPKGGCAWAPRAANRPTPMVKKFYHNMHQYPNNIFHTCDEVQFRSEVVGNCYRSPRWPEPSMLRFAAVRRRIGSGPVALSSPEEGLQSPVGGRSRNGRKTGSGSEVVTVSFRRLSLVIFSFHSSI